MRWTWNPIKAAENLRKHRVSFDLAVRVFGDPHALVLADPYPDEERWRTIGRPSAASPIVLFVVHTWDDETQPDPVSRIISARRAEPHERRAYDEGQF